MKEIDFVEYWAQKCKENMPECQKQVYSMIDAQIQIGNDFYKKMERKKAIKIIKQTKN